MSPFFPFYFKKNHTEAKSTQSRIDNLFEIINLQEQLFHADADNEIDSEIKYNPVDKITDELRIDSLKFLKICLTISKQYLTNN